MAEQPPPAAISSAFPAPPPFYKSFTTPNLESQKTYLDTTNQPTSGPLPTPASGLDLLSLPPELRNLFPPAPPPEGKYRSFGIEHDVSAHIPAYHKQGPVTNAQNPSALPRSIYGVPNEPHASASTSRNPQPSPLLPQLDQYSRNQPRRLASYMG